MNQKELVLAGLASSKGVLFSPVQVQKLFFLIDRNISDEVGGHIFDFQPYNYGPFDKAVYQTLEELEIDGLVDIERGNSYRRYRLTIQGQEAGENLLARLPNYAQQFIFDASEFVRKLSFTQLVSAIYQKYPEMRANSVFQE